MTDFEETFFTRVGCMDGRIQIPLRVFGQKKFHAQYPDSITDPGTVGMLVSDPPQELLDRLKTELNISLQKHKSKGILVSGHQECAANQVDDSTHKEEIKKSVEIVKDLVGGLVSVIGVFVKRSEQDPKIWEVEELN